MYNAFGVGILLSHIMSCLFWRFTVRFKPEIIFRNYKVRERFVRYYAMIISLSSFNFVMKVIYSD